MKITISRRARAFSLIEGLFFMALFLIFISGVFYFMLKACHRLPNGNAGGGNELTNELCYSGPGVVVWQMTNIVSVPTNWTVAEEILYTDNLCSPWQPLTNIVLQPDQVYDWTQLIDRTKPCGFFRITIYGTNSP